MILWSMGVPYDVMAQVLNCDLEVSKFELQSFYYVHFRTNTLEKVINPLTPAQVMG